MEARQADFVPTLLMDTDRLNQPAWSALHCGGRFREALKHLDIRFPQMPQSVKRDPSVLLLRAELWQKLGRTDRSSEAVRVLEHVRTPPQQAIRLLMLQGELAQDRGRRSEAAHFYHRAIERAVACRDSELRLWALLRLLWCGGDTPGGVASIVDHESEFVRTANLTLVTAFNLLLAQCLGKSGDLEGASTRAALAGSLLLESPDPWLQGMLRLQQGCLAHIRGDFGAAQHHAVLAVRAASESGHHRGLCSAAINLGAAYLALGHIHRARGALQWAETATASGTLLHALSVETLAEALLASGDYGDCQSLLERAKAEIDDSRLEMSPWESDWSLATRARLRQALSRPLTTTADAALTPVPQSPSESPVSQRLLLVQAGHLCAEGRPLEALDAVAGVMNASRRLPLPVLAQAEAIKAHVAESQGKLRDASRLYRTAMPMLAAAGDMSDYANCVARFWKLLSRAGVCGPNPDPSAWARATIMRPACVTSRLDSTTVLGEANVPLADGLRHVSSLAWYREYHPALFAEEAARLLVDHDAVSGIRLTDRRKTEAPTLVQWNAHHLDAQPLCIVRVLIPDEDAPQYSLELAVQASAQAFDTVRTIEFLLCATTPRQKRGASVSSTTPAVEATPGGAVFASPQMSSVLSQARRAGVADASVLITGESGTGKEVLARYVHDCSRRASRPFVAVNCSGIPRDLVDSQLFGHRKGSFTGAVETFGGLVRAAEGGTLFLDEVAELPLDAQPKLLRFLDTHEVLSVGDSRPTPTDVRIVAATNADLEALVEGGRFRADLYYRLNVFRLVLPPLRERLEDLDLLIEVFLQDAKRRMRRPNVRISDSARVLLRGFDWPGNARQVSAELLGAVARCGEGDLIGLGDLSSDVRRTPRRRSLTPASSCGLESVSLDQPLPGIIREVERVAVARALTQSGGSLTNAAARLGLSRKGLYLARQRLAL